jgi:hypothetical protein
MKSMSRCGVSEPKEITGELDSLQTQHVAEAGGGDLGSNLPARNRINAHLLVTPSGRSIAYNAATSGDGFFEAATLESVLLCYYGRRKTLSTVASM